MIGPVDLVHMELDNRHPPCLFQIMLFSAYVTSVIVVVILILLQNLLADNIPCKFISIIYVQNFIKY